MTTCFEQNCEALASRSAATAAAVRAAGPDSAFGVMTAASGEPVVERNGRALDGRRSPSDEARRQAATITADRVVVAGFGSGYFVEALLERGIEVTAVIEADAACLAAAMRARDFDRLFRAVPIVLLDALRDVVELATWRATAPALAVHPPCVAASADLAALVAAWPAMRVAKRRPRVLVVGPIYGGSLDVARLPT